MTGFRPELIALDVDGTLLQAGSPMTDRVKRSVRIADDAGIRVVIASGRSTIELQPIVDALGLTSGHTICSNGAVTATVPDQEPIMIHTFDPRPVLSQILGEVPSALVAVERPGQGYLVTERFPEGELLAPQIRVPLPRLLEEPAIRVIVRDVNGSVDDFLRLSERLQIRGVSYAVGYRAWLDLGPEGVTKGTALASLAHSLGIPASRCLAIGDGRNDIEMIRWAGRGVAMGQAPAEVLAVADHITVPVQQDGVAIELESQLSTLANRDHGSGRPSDRPPAWLAEESAKRSAAAFQGERRPS
jgi:hydroxymethylpyrimidine pyrophosphatase-like HAD family hydrolase